MFKNKSGNKCFKYPNETCPNRLCHSQILDIEAELVTDNDCANAFELDAVRSK